MVSSVRGRLDIAMLVVLSAATPAAAQLAGPRVQFDAPYLIAVRELPIPGSNGAGEKLIECRLDVSALVIAGNERDVTQFVFQVQSLQRTMQVHDYLPRSTRDTSITGHVTVSEGSEDSASAGLNLTGKYQDWTTLTANVGESHKENGSRKFDRLPALETVVASGTIYRGTGVYFKLHTTDRQLLEGATCLSIIWRVPAGWRADYLHLQCIAEGRARGQAVQRVGQRDFLIPIHLAGDTGAQTTAGTFARAEAKLRSSARQYVQELTNRPSSPWPRSVSLFGQQNSNDESRAVPHDWLERLLYLPSQPQIPAGLSATARTAATDFLAAREQLHALSGWRQPDRDDLTSR
jgi:hypothetical protein